MILTIILTSMISDSTIAVVAIIFSGLVGFIQWLNAIKRKAEIGERIVAMAKLKEEILEEVKKELNPIEDELHQFRELKSKVDIIDARVGDIFTIINRMSDNLDKYVEKIEDNIERHDARYTDIFKDLYQSKVDKTS